MAAQKNTMADSRDTIATRVIVSCDASPLGASAIDAAAALARQLDADLQGIFVEDINLFRTAALPFAREVAVSTALVSPMQPGELQRVLERQAQSVRDVLSQAASVLRLPWSFQVVRGAPPGCVFDVMREMDLAVFGHAGRFTPAAPARRAAMPMQSAMMVIYDGTPAARRALGAAEALVQRLRGRLVVAVTDVPARLHADMRDRLQRQHPHALFLILKQRDAATVAQAAESYAPAVLLWGGMENAADRATLVTLVDRLRCPVVLVA